MICKNCGKEMEGSPATCPHCGAQVAEKAVALTADGAKKMKKKKSKKKIVIIVIAVIVAVILALGAAALITAYGLLGNVEHEQELSSVHVNEDLPDQKTVWNIALFGLDTRQNNSSGRSDAMIILSLDYQHNKIKMTSIARDTFVKVNKTKGGQHLADGNYDKLTHAWAYGKQNLAVDTINRNFKMNIQDYVFVNFYEFAEIIDYIGGVYIDVDASEMQVMNTKYTPYIREYGIDCPDITKTGNQLLNGGQALAYARNRYTGNDVTRGNRQREVLEAAFNQVKDLPLTKFPTLISKALSICHTDLESGELMDIATWALTSSPSIESLSLPTKECNAKSGKDAYIGGTWYYIYDLDIATDIMHEFIYETKADEETNDPAAE